MPQMDIPEIVKFEELVSSFLPKNRKYVKSDKKFLTSPGENYASLILAIDITTEDEESKQEVLHTVAKLLAPSEFMRKFMNISCTVRNELEFYQTILPTLRNFIEGQGSKFALNFFPNYYGGRYSLDPNSKILDDNAIVLLENLKPEGYVLLDNFQGLDLDVTQLVLSHMAELHASVIALKETQPAVFQEKLMPFFDEFEIFLMGDDNDQFMTCDVVVNGILSILQDDELCSLHIEKIKDTIDGCKKNLNLPKNTPKLQQDTFSSLIHADLWINNLMVKTKSNKVVDIKFLDWQLYEYASVTKDLLFFIGSSVRENVFKQHFDDLLKFYHDRLIENLKELKCGVEKFPFDAFLNEFGKMINEAGYLYCMMAIPSIFPTGDNVIEVHEINKERMLNQVKVSEFCRDRIRMITRKLIQNGWIK